MKFPLKSLMESLWQDTKLYLSAALTTPATKRPGSPGKSRRTSMTKKGTIWSAFVIAYIYIYPTYSCDSTDIMLEACVFQFLIVIFTNLWTYRITVKISSKYHQTKGAAKENDSTYGDKITPHRPEIIGKTWLLDILYYYRCLWEIFYGSSH